MLLRSLFSLCFLFVLLKDSGSIEHHMTLEDLLAKYGREKIIQYLSVYEERALSLDDIDKILSQKFVETTLTDQEGSTPMMSNLRDISLTTTKPLIKVIKNLTCAY